MCARANRIGVDVGMLGLLLIGAALVATINVRATGAAAPFRAQSLVNAPEGQIQRAALEYVRVKGFAVSGTPRIVLTWPITAAQLAAQGIGDFISGSDVPLAVVVLKGDFAFNHGQFPAATTPSWNPGAGYVALIFDLRVGVPTVITHCAS